MTVNLVKVPAKWSFYQVNLRLSFRLYPVLRNTDIIGWSKSGYYKITLLARNGISRRYRGNYDQTLFLQPAMTSTGFKHRTSKPSVLTMKAMAVSYIFKNRISKLKLLKQTFFENKKLPFMTELIRP